MLDHLLHKLTPESHTPGPRIQHREDGLAYVHMRKVLVCSHAHNLCCDQSNHTAPIPYHLRDKVPDITFGTHGQDGQPEVMFGAGNRSGHVQQQVPYQP
jgi:hypothetical protein